MPNVDLNLESGGILVRQSIFQREEEYYLITKNEINNISSDKKLSDIFILISSLLIGAFFSVIIGKTSSINMATEVKNILSVYQWVFLAFGLLFSLLAAIYWYKTKKSVNAITSSGQLKLNISKQN